MPVGAVLVVMKAELRGVAVPLRVLPEQVGDEDRLVPEMKRVQFAVHVLFQHPKPGDVELVSVVPVIAVKPDAQVCVAENESAKIADERLYARSDRSRIEVRAVLPPFTATEEPEDFGRVSKPNLAECSLQRDLRFSSRQT